MFLVLPLWIWCSEPLCCTLSRPFLTTGRISFMSVDGTSHACMVIHDRTFSYSSSLLPEALLEKLICHLLDVVLDVLCFYPGL